MAEWECSLQSVLNGGSTPQSNLQIDLCSPSAEKFIPITKETVCYIVAAVLFNEQGQVLLVQEAKKSCYGQWYLPAGRMENNESLQEAVKREVKEESGLEFEPETLTSVEIGTPATWYRFTFTGSITGGSLKTTAQRDSESLQARWCDVQLLKERNSNFILRSTDILRPIDISAAHRDRNTTSHHPPLLPAIVPHKKMLMRVVLFHTFESTMTVLVKNEDQLQFPVAVIQYNTNVYGTLMLLTKHVFGDVIKEARFCGVLAVEHCGTPARANDGCCLTVLIQITQTQLPALVDTNKFQWRTLQTETARETLQHVSKYAVPFLCNS